MESKVENKISKKVIEETEKKPTTRSKTKKTSTEGTTSRAKKTTSATAKSVSENTVEEGKKDVKNKTASTGTRATAKKATSTATKSVAKKAVTERTKTPAKKATTEEKIVTRKTTPKETTSKKTVSKKNTTTKSTSGEKNVAKKSTTSAPKSTTKKVATSDLKVSEKKSMPSARRSTAKESITGSAKIEEKRDSIENLRNATKRAETSSTKRNLSAQSKAAGSKKSGNIIYKEQKKENRFDINDLDKKLKERKHVPGKDKVSIIKNSFYNLVYAGVFILFLVFCNYGYYHIEKNAMIKNMNLFSFLFLGVSIMLMETAYKEDKMKKCINGIETLLVGILTLLLPYILQIYTESFVKTLWISGISIFVYYMVKSIIALLINKRNFLIRRDNISKEKNDNEFEEEYED